MKRLFRLLLILGLAAGTWSCADDGTPSVSINGGTDFLSLDHLARSGKITVNAPRSTLFPYTTLFRSRTSQKKDRQGTPRST